MITAKEALELTQQPEPEVSDEEFQQCLNQVEVARTTVAQASARHAEELAAFLESI